MVVTCRTRPADHAPGPDWGVLGAMCNARGTEMSQTINQLEAGSWTRVLVIFILLALTSIHHDHQVKTTIEQGFCRGGRKETSELSDAIVPNRNVLYDAWPVPLAGHPAPSSRALSCRTRKTSGIGAATLRCQILLHSNSASQSSDTFQLVLGLLSASGSTHTSVSRHVTSACASSHPSRGGHLQGEAVRLSCMIYAV